MKYIRAQKETITLKYISESKQNIKSTYVDSNINEVKDEKEDPKKDNSVMHDHNHAYFIMQLFGWRQ